MALTLRSVGTSTSAASGLTVSIPKPSGLAIGDLMIAYVMFNANGGGVTFMSAPDATWSIIDYEHRANITHGIFYKIATSTDTAASSFGSFTDAVSGANIGRIYAFSSGYDPTYPVAWNVGGGTGAAAVNTWPGITGFYQTNAYLVAALSGGNTNYNPTSISIAGDDPGGWAKANSDFFGDATSIANGSLWVSNQRVPVTDTGNITATVTTNRPDATTLFSILPTQVITNFSDYYPEGESSTSQITTGTAINARAQAFNGNGGTLTSAAVSLLKNGAPTGNINLAIYATTGTFGSTMTPTGSALATSDNFDVSTLSISTFGLKTFTFSGANQITLTNGTKYALALLVNIGDGSNFVRLNVDSSGYLLHPGNSSSNFSGGTSWTPDATIDIPFYVTTAASSTTNKTISATQSSTVTLGVNRYYRQTVAASTSSSAFKAFSALKPTTPIVKTTPDNATSYSREVLADNPVSYFRMNALTGSGEADIGSLHNTATYLNNPTLGATGALASSDTAVSFTGNGGIPSTQQYMIIPDNDQYSFITNRGLTIEFLAKTPSSKPATYVPVWVSKLGSGGNNSEYRFSPSFGLVTYPSFTVFNSSGTSNVSVGNSTFFPTPGLPVITSGVWHHYAVTLQDSAGLVNLALYMDGQAVATNQWVSDFLINGLGDIFIGGEQSSAARDSNIFRNINGYMDEIAIYNYALSSSRLLSHYNAINSAQNQTVEVKAITKGRTISQAQSLSPLKQCGRALRATVTTVAVVLRSLLFSRTLAAIVSTVNTTISRSLFYGRTFVATVTTPTTLQKQCRRIFSGIATTSSPLLKQVNKSVVSTVVTSGSFIRQAGKGCIALLVTSGSTVKSIGKISLVVQASIVSLTRPLIRSVILSAIAVTNASLIKQVLKNVNAVVATTALVGRQAGRGCNAAVTTTATVLRQTGKILTGSVSTITTRTRDYATEVLADNPISYWRMDASSGVTETDRGSLANNGTYINSPTLGVIGALTYDPAVKFVASSSQSMSAPDNDAYSIATTNAFSVECLINSGGIINTAPPTAFTNVVTKGKSGQFEWGWQRQQDGKILFQIWNAAGTTQSSKTGDIPASGTWHHYVATTQDNAGTSTLSVYEDGVFKASGNFTTANVSNGTGNIRIGGRDDNANFFDGLVDEVAIYNYALSPARIAAHVAAIGSNSTVVQKGITKTGPSYSQATSGSLIKQVGKFPRAVVTTSAAYLRGFQKVLGVTVSTPSSVSKSIFKIIFTPVITIASLAKLISFNRTILVTQVTIGTVIKSINKSIQPIAVSISVSCVKGFRRVCSATVSTPPSLLKSALKIRLTTVTTGITIPRAITKGILVAQVTSASAIKFISKSVVAASQAVASATKQDQKSIPSATVTTTVPTVVRQVGKVFLTPVLTTISRIPRAITRGILVVQQTLDVPIKFITHYPLIASVVSRVTVDSQKLQTLTSILVAVNVATAATMGNFRIFKNFIINSPVIVTYPRTIFRLPFTITNSVISTVQKRVLKPFMAYVYDNISGDPYGFDLFGSGPFGLGTEFIMLTKMVLKPFATIVSSTPTTLNKATAKILLITSVTIVSCSKFGARVFSVLVTTKQNFFGQGGFGFGNFGIGTILLKQIQKNIKLSAVALATTLTKTISKPISQFVQTTVSLGKALTKPISIGITSSLQVIKQISKPIKPVSTTVGSITRRCMKVFTTPINTTHRISRFISKRVIVSCSTVVTTGKNISNRIFRITVNTLPIARKTILKPFRSTIVAVVTLPVPTIIKVARVIFKMVGFTRIRRHFKTSSNQQIPHIKGYTKANPVEGDIDAKVVGHTRVHPIEGDDDSTFIKKSNS